MAETYFSNFNTIIYANNQAVDLTERVVVTNNKEKNPYIYYPTDITNGARADQIASVVYDDPFSSWLLYLTNDIVDPYYEWYLNTNQFNVFVGSKYGSVEKAQQKVSYYYNNWVDQADISPAAFSALGSGQKKYWEPTYDNFGRISAYERKKVDWHAATNYVVSLTVVNGNTFVKDEIVKIKYTDQSTGTAQVAFANNTTLMIQHCSGDFFPRVDEDIIISDTSYVYGQESLSNCAVTQCTFIANNIPTDEYAYWLPKSYYEVEQEKNEGNRTIRVMQPQYAPQFIRNAKQLLEQ